ncbi:SGNH/GDSL hydrolase family protein [Flavobacteriaceae bacterium F89]|uniref:SGNH/GDSL hydrolase family protein n=1 Tax=Cerina litoralis TaxID=2874477 RepID=A0AAE3EWC1_9FLAO|nr:SGNH/GDSL hydrolase family protein [Cerina litoralis]MCG2462083.1 SGNH/GDSL hydrolase family protein [Cerina litoralis]
MRLFLLVLFIIGVSTSSATRYCNSAPGHPLSLLSDSILPTDKQDKYDFSTEKIINDLGEFDLIINDSTIIFDSAYGKIDAPLHYGRSLNDFNFDGIYKIIDIRNQSYYFRFGWVTFKNDQTIFSNIKWLKEDVPESGNYKILTIDLKFKQHGHISLCTIGDSQTWWNCANNLRLELNNNLPDLFFVGSRTDINGYPHEGEGGNRTNQVLDRINYIPKADYYTLLIGTNDWQDSIDSAFKNTIQICNILLKKYPQSKILYLTPIPTTNTVRDQFNTKLEERLTTTFKANKSIDVVDIGGKMRENLDWSKVYLLKDGLHENPDGVKVMAELIAIIIKSERK